MRCRSCPLVPRLVPPCAPAHRSGIAFCSTDSQFLHETLDAHLRRHEAAAKSNPPSVNIRMDATGWVLLVSTLGVLYQWPHLRSVCWRMLQWLIGLTLVLIGLILLTIHLKDSIAIESPLYLAATAGDLTRVAELLGHQHVRTNIDAGTRIGPLGVLFSATPLYAAAIDGHTDVVAALLKAGANPETPLTVCLGVLASQPPLYAAAAGKGHTDVVAALLEAGAKPDTPLTVGRGLLFSATPLYAAGQKGHFDVVAALLNARADPEELDVGTAIRAMVVGRMSESSQLSKRLSVK